VGLLFAVAFVQHRRKGALATPSTIPISDYSTIAGRVSDIKKCTEADLVNPKNPNAADARKLVDVGTKVGIQVVIVSASSEEEMKTA
jgi:hypothetical protein